MSVPNQKRVTIAKREKRDGQHLYATMNLEALEDAVKNLNGSGFKLWTYMNKNQDNYSFELSQAACAEYGIKKDSYYNAVNELIKKGYLLAAYEGSNIFYFYEKPRNENDDCNKWFSEETNSEPENPKIVSKNPPQNSEKTERNNTTNTLTNKYNTDFDNESFEDKIYERSMVELDFLKQSYPTMNQWQKTEYTKMRCQLDSLSPVYFDKKKKAKIISDAFQKIHDMEAC